MLLYALQSEGEETKPALKVLTRLCLDLPSLALLTVFSGLAYQLKRMNKDLDATLVSLEAQQTTSSQYPRQQLGRVFTAKASDLEQADSYLSVEEEGLNEDNTECMRMVLGVANIAMLIVYAASFIQSKSCQPPFETSDSPISFHFRPPGDQNGR